MLKICNGDCGKRPVYWIDGGLHAREWISPAAVTYWIEVPHHAYFTIYYAWCTFRNCCLQTARVTEGWKRALTGTLSLSWTKMDIKLPEMAMCMCISSIEFNYFHTEASFPVFRGHRKNMNPKYKRECNRMLNSDGSGLEIDHNEYGMDRYGYGMGVDLNRWYCIVLL